MGFASETSTHHRAGDAAGARAAECRDRLGRLRSSSGSVEERDVAIARDRLASARVRAAAALERLQTIQRWQVAHRFGASLFSRQRCQLPALLGDLEDVASEPAKRLFAAVRDGVCKPAELWLDFACYGGEASRVEFDAYVNGAWLMSESDRTVLEHVWWERERFP